MYKIKYNYNTGDSFKESCGLEDFLEYVWSNLEIAKANLQRIKEHYEWYRLKNKQFYFDSSKEKEVKNKIKEYQTKDWFVKKHDSIKLMLDNENFVQFWPPWVGYFESLNYVEIVDEKMKVSFK